MGNKGRTIYVDSYFPFVTEVRQKGAWLQVLQSYASRVY